MDFGPRLPALQALREAGNPVPALDRMPELDDAIEWLWDAYLVLEKGRTWIMGNPQPIPLTEVMAYGELVGLDREDAVLLLEIVRKLDDAYFKKVAKKAENGRTGSNRRRKASAARR